MPKKTNHIFIDENNEKYCLNIHTSFLKVRKAKSDAYKQKWNFRVSNLENLNKQHCDFYIALIILHKWKYFFLLLFFVFIIFIRYYTWNSSDTPFEIIAFLSKQRESCEKMEGYYSHLSLQLLLIVNLSLANVGWQNMIVLYLKMQVLQILKVTNVTLLWYNRWEI